MIRDMRTPVIGLTTRTLPLRAAAKDRPTETLPRAYTDALEAEGALPVLLPTPADPARAADYLALVDGLLLTGGDDPHPRLFGERPHPRIEVVDERRDAFEIQLVRAARAGGWPVFGICRGSQMMNVALGGDIYQDIPSQAETDVQHVQRTLDDGPWHEIEIAADTRLRAIAGAARVRVNSFHHQACRALGEGLVACGLSAGDGLVEAVEDPAAAFFLGVQWHPELGVATGDPLSKGLFAAFTAAARERAGAASKESRPAPVPARPPGR